MRGTIEENPWPTQKKSLKDVFTAVNIKPAHYGCEQQHGGDMMYNIFDGWEGCKQPSHVLLYGDPGIGKTTLCQKYAWDWASNDMANQHVFNQFKVVVLLKLHDVKGTLEEIVEAQLFYSRLSEPERQMFFASMKENPEWFLFILDGVNECNLDKIPSVKKFLANDLYRGVSVIATSRPELTRSWVELCRNFQARFCVKGYSDEKVLKFVESHLKDDTTKAEKLKASIHASTKLMNLARTPLLTPIICELWRKNDKLPTLPTMTKLLNNCFNAVITKHCLNRREDWNPHSNLPTEIQDQLNRLEKLAFHGVKECSMNYTQADLERYGIDSTCDLLRAQPETSTPLKGGDHCFTHKSIQEFVAAKWLVKNWNTEEVSKEVSAMLEDTNITKFHSILVFVAGLLSCELNQDHLLKFIERLSNGKYNFLQEGYYGYRMQLLLESCCEAWQKESDDEESSIAKGILSLTKTKELFRKVITPCELPFMGVAEVEGLSLVMPKLGLTSLNLSGIWIQEREAEILANDCLHSNRSLTSVKFSHCCLCPGVVEIICKALETMPKLEKVDLSCNNLSSKGLTAVARLLNCSPTPTVKVLWLDNDFDKSHVELLQEKCQSQGRHLLQKTLSRQELVKKLFAFGDERQRMSPNDEVILDLINAFNDEDCELEEISLHHYQIGNEIVKWLNAFQEKDSLIKVGRALRVLSTLHTVVDFPFLSLGRVQDFLA